MLPLLKYPGGKRKLVPYIESFWHPYQNCRLVELFAGGAAVSLALSPKYCLLNDLNPHVINFYNQIKSGMIFDIPMYVCKDLYSQYRFEFNNLITEGLSDSKLGAQLFYYLNKTCYNGLIRFNKSGFFNVPVGSYKKVNFTIENLSLYKKFFNNSELFNRDFSDISIDSNDFVYADPPYDTEFKNYYKSFDWSEQKRLAIWLSRLGVPVVISNQATDRIVQLYESLGFNCKFVSVRRFVSCKQRKKVKEVIASIGI